VVSLDGEAAERLAARRNRRCLPDEVAVLVADDTRAATAARRGHGPTTTKGGSQISWAAVDGPGALAEVGEKIDRCLSAWTDRDVEICVDSVTALLDAADLPTAYRFLHVLMRRIDAAGAVAHYHLDCEASDRDAASVVETLFSDVREYDPVDGSWVEA
jgi:hypothetical protein